MRDHLVAKVAQALDRFAGVAAPKAALHTAKPRR
jgi:hypothetical protein